jgi:hypothetical protein
MRQRALKRHQFLTKWALANRRFPLFRLHTQRWILIGPGCLDITIGLTSRAPSQTVAIKEFFLSAPSFMATSDHIIHLVSEVHLAPQVPWANRRVVVGISSLSCTTKRIPLLGSFKLHNLPLKIVTYWLTVFLLVSLPLKQSISEIESFLSKGISTVILQRHVTS